MNNTIDLPYRTIEGALAAVAGIAVRTKAGDTTVVFVKRRKNTLVVAGEGDAIHDLARTEKARGVIGGIAFAGIAAAITRYTGTPTP